MLSYIKLSLTFLLFLLLLPTFLFASGYRTCTKVIDGDTIILDDQEKVRLMGVDTPETLHPIKPVQFFGKEAFVFTKRMVEGKKVRLEYDWQRIDKYGRTLAYVYLPDGTFLNAEIIKQGYGFAYTKFPFKFLEEFRQYEKEAREQKVGLWKGGGRAELTWLKKQGRKPFLIYEMSNNCWGIEYNGFIKTRINDEELLTVLDDLRLWVNEYSERDLADILLRSGWEKE